MGEFNKRHLDLITYFSVIHAKTVLVLYTGNIKKMSESHIFHFAI